MPGSQAYPGKHTTKPFDFALPPSGYVYGVWDSARACIHNTQQIADFLHPQATLLPAKDIQRCGYKCSSGGPRTCDSPVRGAVGGGEDAVDGAGAEA